MTLPAKSSQRDLVMLSLLLCPGSSKSKPSIEVSR